VIECVFAGITLAQKTLVRLLDTQEAVGSSPIPPISQTLVIKGFGRNHSCVIHLSKCCATLMTTLLQLFFEVNTMSRSRPASNPISYHKHTKQYYVTRGGRRIYLGAVLLHNSNGGRVFVWSRFASSDHLTARHPQRHHRI